MNNPSNPTQPFQMPYGESTSLPCSTRSIRPDCSVRRFAISTVAVILDGPIWSNDQTHRQNDCKWGSESLHTEALPKKTTESEEMHAQNAYRNSAVNDTFIRAVPRPLLTGKWPGSSGWRGRHLRRVVRQSRPKWILPRLSGEQYLRPHPCSQPTDWQNQTRPWACPAHQTLLKNCTAQGALTWWWPKQEHLASLQKQEKSESSVSVSSAYPLVDVPSLMAEISPPMRSVSNPGRSSRNNDGSRTKAASLRLSTIARINSVHWCIQQKPQAYNFPHSTLVPKKSSPQSVNKRPPMAMWAAASSKPYSSNTCSKTDVNWH